MRYRRPPLPTREDLAAEKAVRECAARGHDHPDEPLRPAESFTGPDGATHHTRRTPCRECGTLKVTTWQEPEPGQGAFMAIGTFEAPEPGDVPRLAERAARITDAELAAALERARPHGVRRGDLAPDRRATARTETLELGVSVRSRQFYLLDRDADLAAIIPVPGDAESAGLADVVPGAAVFWTPDRTGPVPLTVVVSPHDPGADLDGHDDVIEISYRAATGYVRVRELGGNDHELPPLPAGYGGYRLRHHVRNADSGDAAYLLQIGPEARRGPLSLKSTSRWGTALQADAFTL